MYKIWNKSRVIVRPSQLDRKIATISILISIPNDMGLTTASLTISNDIHSNTLCVHKSKNIDNNKK